MTPNSSTDSATRDGLEVVAKIQQALDAGPTPGEWSHEHRMGFDGFWNTEVFDTTGMAIATLTWLPRPPVDGVTGTYREANAQWIAACSPIAIQTLLTLLAASRAEVERLRADAERYRLIRAGYCVLELLTPEARPEEGLNYRQSTLRAELNYGNAEEGDALDRFIDAALAAIPTKKD